MILTEHDKIIISMLTVYKSLCDTAVRHHEEQVELFVGEIPTNIEDKDILICVKSLKKPEDYLVQDTQVIVTKGKGKVIRHVVTTLTYNEEKNDVTASSVVTGERW